MKYRCMFPDTFLIVDAASESEAQKKARQDLIRTVDSSEFICWKVDEDLNKLDDEDDSGEWPETRDSLDELNL